MNSNVPGLDETEEVRSESPAVESPEPTMVDAPEPAQDGENAAAPQAEETVSESQAPATMEANAEESDADEGAETVNDDPAAPSEGEWLAQDTSDQKGLKRGVVLEGTVTTTSPTAVYVDVGEKTDGVIPGRELERMNKETLDMLKPGEKVSVFVVNPHDHNGDLILAPF